MCNALQLEIEGVIDERPTRPTREVERKSNPDLESDHLWSVLDRLCLSSVFRVKDISESHSIPETCDCIGF